MQHYSQETCKGSTLTGKTSGTKTLSRLYVFTEQNLTDNHTGNTLFAIERTAAKTNDIFLSDSMCTEVLPSTEILNTSGDADHAPVLARLPLTCMNFLKPGPDPIPLPRAPRLKTPVPQEDLKEFKKTFDQETGASTANLLDELGSTLELAYTMDRCTSRKLEGLRKGLHKVAMHHRDAKPEGEDLLEACNKMRDVVQTEQNKVFEQHRNSFPQPPRQNDRKSWQEYEQMRTKARRTAAKSKDKITKDLK